MIVDSLLRHPGYKFEFARDGFCKSVNFDEVCVFNCLKFSLILLRKQLFHERLCCTTALSQSRTVQLAATVVSR
jgi:hypothetical protein